MAFPSLCALLHPAVWLSQRKHQQLLYKWKNVLAVIGSDLSGSCLFSWLGCLESLYCPSEEKTDSLPPQHGLLSTFSRDIIMIRWVEINCFPLDQCYPIAHSTFLEMFSLLSSTKRTFSPEADRIPKCQGVMPNAESLNKCRAVLMYAPRGTEAQ